MQKRKSLQIMSDTVHALLMRELKTRFGSSKLGYFWAIVEPVGQVAILAILFTLIGRRSIAGVPVALFIITGVMTYSVFRKITTNLSKAISSNRALLTYRQVSPIDPVLTRFVIEFATFFIIYLIIISIMTWVYVYSFPADVLGVILASILLMCFSLGLALCLSCLLAYWADADKIITMIMRPMFFISGVFYCATMIPNKYWFLFDWNPVFHAIELSRSSFFETYESPIGDWKFLFFTSLVSLVLGLMLYRFNRIRFVTL